MDHLPIFFNMQGRRALLLGGGTVAARKADLLLRAGARLRVISPEVSDEMARLLQQHGVTHKTEQLSAADLDGCALAFGAASDQAANRKLHELATAAGVPVNVADNTQLCDFIMPAVVDRSPLLVAIASGGTTPLLTRMLKARFETTIPAAYGRLAEFAGGWRERVKDAIPNMTRRRRFWETMISGPVAEHLFSGQEQQAAALMQELLGKAAADGAKPPQGEVYLVGTGPGDPDLLTFRALRLMQQADVVLYDRLIGDGILNLVRRDAKRIYVGKMPQEHTVPQEEIGAMLIRLAQEGQRVLRLKGGDPFVFGRGGEEIATLAEHGVTFQVIPGVTAANGCAAYAGIPLTHRDHAQGYVVVTGHEKDGKLNLNWDSLIQPRQTVVVYMGLASLGTITAGFMEHGAAPDTPAAVIENGTRAGQRVITGTLATLQDQAVAAEVRSPALVIIGSVVTLRDQLSWFADDAAPNWSASL
ncbi:MAG: siroheme synthase CysG [Gammaproteobacteria bacterium]|nr:MAG: siroheme synthase CysG [Gammaproteobacteria bacterium]